MSLLEGICAQISISASAPKIQGRSDSNMNTNVKTFQIAVVNCCIKVNTLFFFGETNVALLTTPGCSIYLSQ